MEGQDVFKNKDSVMVEVAQEEKGDSFRPDNNLGGFSEQQLRRETIVKDFVVSGKEEYPAIDKSKGEISGGDVVVESDSPIYIVFRDGISRGVDMVLEDPNGVEDLWNALSQNPDYYNELLKRKEIL